MSDGGIWRTVSGRRIFIKDGQDISSAMKDSGKFNKANFGKYNSKGNKGKKDPLDKDDKGWTSKKLLEKEQEIIKKLRAEEKKLDNKNLTANEKKEIKANIRKLEKEGMQVAQNRIATQDRERDLAKTPKEKDAVISNQMAGKEATAGTNEVKYDAKAEQQKVIDQMMGRNKEEGKTSTNDLFNKHQAAAREREARDGIVKQDSKKENYNYLKKEMTKRRDELAAEYKKTGREAAATEADELTDKLDDLDRERVYKARDTVEKSMGVKTNANKLKTGSYANVRGKEHEVVEKGNVSRASLKEAKTVRVKGIEYYSYTYPNGKSVLVPV